jgi:hypothetical protein
MDKWLLRINILIDKLRRCFKKRKSYSYMNYINVGRKNYKIPAGLVEKRRPD